MKKILSLFCFVIITGTIWSQQHGVEIAPIAPTSASPGFVFSRPEYAVQNFLYAGQYLNHYGSGFHSFNDQTSIGGVNAYVSSYFGIDLFTGGQRRFRINANGNVGVGGSPSTKLDVGHFQNGVASNKVVLRLRNTVGQNLYSGWGSAIEFFDMSNNIESMASLNEGGAKIISEASDYGWAHNLKFRVVTNNNYSNQTGIDALVIRNDGNVGIGTPNPDAKLAVNGTIHSQEVRVDMIGWPDYVFNQEYKLPTLTELQHYIQQNKHLPEVPSASEVEQNGVNLGEMNKLLLKKVEELTLYVIEQNKRVDEQQIEINNLKNKIRN